MRHKQHKLATVAFIYPTLNSPQLYYIKCMIIGRENFHFELKIEVFAHREQTGTVVSASAQIESGIESEIDRK